jgi:hypothetical protein
MRGMKKAVLTLLAVFLLTPAFSQVKKAVSGSGAPGANVYRMEEGFVDAHGVLIYYKIIGRGAPLMVVHGGPGASHDYLLPYLLPLARTNKLIFIDEQVQAVRRSWKTPANIRLRTWWRTWKASDGR